jgi:hypothetical protein
MQQSARVSDYSWKAKNYNEMWCWSITVSPGENAAMSRLQLKGLERSLHLCGGIGEKGVKSTAISKTKKCDAHQHIQIKIDHEAILV